MKQEQHENPGSSTSGAQAPQWIGPLIAGGGFLLLLGLVGSIGAPLDLASFAARVRSTLASVGPVLFLALTGWGWLALRLLGIATGSTAGRGAPVGVGVLLASSASIGAFVGFVPGMLGAWTSVSGRVLFVVAGVGLFGFLLRQAWRDQHLEREAGGVTRPGLASPRVPRELIIVAALPVAILLVAASSPPGWLWDSEFRGFDALSYHLQLPLDWLAQGRVWPVEFNVYSYLPGMLESAFTLGAGLARPEFGIASQMMHAMFAIAAALAAGDAARLAIQGQAQRDAANMVARVAACGLFIATPWVVVTGSLAYNEMGLAACLAAALAFSLAAGIPAWRRGAVVGLLVGVACGMKATAILFVAPPVGMLLLGVRPRREWVALVASGSAAGLLALTPWLVRNWLSSGNPVFPYLVGVFGDGHWNAEQVARYASAHHFDGSLLDRLRLMFAADSADPAGARHRGLMHPQWGLFFPLVALCMGSLLVPRIRQALRRGGDELSNRREGERSIPRIATLLTIGIALQLAAWLAFTHVQSRFLLPVATTGSVLFGVLAGAGMRAAAKRAARGTDAKDADQPPRERRLAPLVLAPIAVQSLILLAIFTRQANLDPRSWLGNPNAARPDGGEVFTGEAFRQELESRPPAARRELEATLSPIQFVNLVLPPESRVYLVGDATPFYLTKPVMYRTTWDAGPLELAIEAAPNAPEAWIEGLLRAGATHVLLNASELERYQRSGASEDRPSGWRDPRLPEAGKLVEWLETRATRVRAWPDLGVGLYGLGQRASGEERDSSLERSP
ncbi:MAG: hypothetical protein SFZ23_01355 [Planctomycetota bacterium]|nr:hypothetical protein [Planctomycetota bacterium]